MTKQLLSDRSGWFSKTRKQADSRGKRRAATGRRARRRELLVERLETRQMLSADVITGLIGNEPAVAVSPLDPNVVAVAQFRTIAISRDGGATFPGALTVNVPPLAGYAGGGGDPSLAFDAQGRLYFSYLASNQAPANPSFFLALFSARIDNVDTGTPTIAQNQLVSAETNTDHHDKEWIAVDSNPDSPFAGNAYIVWSQLGNSQQIMFSRSTNAGATWSAASPISGAAVAGPNAGNAFQWPSHIAVAPNGDLYTGWHNDTCGATTATMSILRDSSGGADFANADGGALNPVQSSSFQAAVTCNVQDGSGDEVPMVNAWMQGALQPFILPDPNHPGNVYVVANDDPNDAFGSGDDGDVILARSTDSGNNWSLSTISHAPAGSLQAYPFGAIDGQGNITVSWYDTRRGLIGPGEDRIAGNADDMFLLDLYSTTSRDAGLSFSNDFRVNDQPFDPTADAPCRFGPQPVCGTVTPGTGRTLRIGEYNGVAAADGLVYTTWTGNGADTNGNGIPNQDILLDKYSMLGAFQDRFEGNNSRATATILGSLPKITLQDLTLHQTTDVDYFKYNATETGKLLLSLYFDHATPNVNAGTANLSLTVRDTRGNIIATGTQSVILPSLAVERISIPVVSQESYFIEVSSTLDIVDNPVVYDLEIENFATPVPSAVVLDPASDSGSLSKDGVTNDSTPHIFIEADLTDFSNMNIPLLTAAQANGGVTPGAAVQVSIMNIATGVTTTGFADRIGTSTTLWDFTPAPALADAGYLVSAAVRIFDGQRDALGAPAPAMDRSQLSEPQWLTIDTTVPAAGGVTADLLAASDSGMFDNDNVTNKMQPAFSGTVEANSRVLIFANGELVGQTVASPGGIWEITVEPLDDGGYDLTLQVEDAAGNVQNVDLDFNPNTTIDIWIDTVEPNTPYLDLTTDSGRSDKDDVTNDSTPSFIVVASDTVDGGLNPFHHDIKWRIYDRVGDANGEVLVADQASLSTAGSFAPTLPVALADGVHNLKLEVEDRAGNLSHDFLLTVVIDTVVPPVSLGLPGNTIDGIDPGGTDTGVPGFPSTNVDRMTSDTGTSFWGRTEADSIVRLYVDGVSNDAIGNPAQFSLTVAEPLNGDNAFPNGQWLTHFIRDLNDPAFFAHDGVREILVEAEDLAGNVNTVSNTVGDVDQSLDIFVDTQGPRITDVDFNSPTSTFDVFDPKPESDGPTPLVNSLVIHVRDLPNRVDPPTFLYDAVFEAVAENPGHYQVVGDHNGPITISSVVFTRTQLANGLPAEGYLTITFAAPLPDDRFTLTISDALVDQVGNHLDGESNADEPQESPAIPTGDGVPGGSFIGRFTVDTRAELGVWAAGSVYVDTNGNFALDVESQDGDDTNEDIAYVLGFTSDNIFAGNFKAPAAATADGFDKIAAYGYFGGGYRWLIDADNDGVPNLALNDPLDIDGLPFAGDFSAANSGDEVGLKKGNTWYLDTNANYVINASEALPGNNMVGQPIVGDFDGDGNEDLGAWADNRFSLNLSTLGPIDGFQDVSFTFGFAGVKEKPLAADFDGDGIDDLGLWVPDRSGATPAETAEWYILVSGGSSLTSRIVPALDGGANTVYFEPIPFGRDIYAQFSDDFALPVPGNFDPPVVPSTGGAAAMMTDTNHAMPLDVTGDGEIGPRDVLAVINVINGAGDELGTLGLLDDIYPDINGDTIISAADVLPPINFLNAQAALSGGSGEGEHAAGLLTSGDRLSPLDDSPAPAAVSIVDDTTAASASASPVPTPSLSPPNSTRGRSQGNSVRESVFAEFVRPLRDNSGWKAIEVTAGSPQPKPTPDELPPEFDLLDDEMFGALAHDVVRVR